MDEHRKLTKPVTLPVAGKNHVPHQAKLQRHAAILRVIKDRRIESQDELREALAGEGFAVTQATLSRDIRELGLAKLVDPQGGAFYANPSEGQMRPDLGKVLPALLVSVEGAGPLLVLKTASGGAGAVGAAIDQAGWSEVIGTIAGEDTVLVITRSGRHRQAVAGRLESLAR
jgi:transcriptional regulator of arginine metabolism